jgi:hypothetical protein
MEHKRRQKNISGASTTRVEECLHDSQKVNGAVSMLVVAEYFLATK